MIVAIVLMESSFDLLFTSYPAWNDDFRVSNMRLNDGIEFLVILTPLAFLCYSCHTLIKYLIEDHFLYVKYREMFPKDHGTDMNFHVFHNFWSRKSRAKNCSPDKKVPLLSSNSPSPPLKTSPMVDSPMCSPKMSLDKSQEGQEIVRNPSVISMSVLSSSRSTKNGKHENEGEGREETSLSKDIRELEEESSLPPSSSIGLDSENDCSRGPSVSTVDKFSPWKSPDYPKRLATVLVTTVIFVAC